MSGKHSHRRSGRWKEPEERVRTRAHSARTCGFHQNGPEGPGSKPAAVPQDCASRRFDKVRVVLHSLLLLVRRAEFGGLDFRSVVGSRAVSLPARKLISMSSSELLSSILDWKSKVVQMHRNEDLRAFRQTLSESANMAFFPQPNQRSKSPGLIISSHQPETMKAVDAQLLL